MSQKMTGSVKWFNETKGLVSSLKTTAVKTCSYTSSLSFLKASKLWLKASV